MRYKFRWRQMKLQSSLFHLMCSSAHKVSRSVTDTEIDRHRNHAFEHFKIKCRRWRQVTNSVTHDKVYNEVKPRAP